MSIQDVPEEFGKIIAEFINDIIATFPEYELIINKWWKCKEAKDITDPIERQDVMNKSNAEKLTFIHNYCLSVFPERFFEIVQQSETLFSVTSTHNTEFLPGVSFKYIMNSDISENTRETIWKYLKLITISLASNAKKDNTFLDTAKLFDSFNHEDFKEKMQDTMEKMQNVFESSVSPNTETANKTGSENTNDVPFENNPLLNKSMTSMLDGKLGDLAREIAEETAGNLDIDMENVTDVKDVFQKLFKNPGKLMNLVKNVGDKLDSRIKSGEINEKELMSEASDIMSKMKNMPGMGNIQEMLGKMGMGGLGGKGGGGGGGEGLGNMQEMMEQMGGMDGIQEMMGKMGLGRNKKVDVNAMEAKLERNKKNEQMKERMKKNMILKQQQLQQQQLQQQQLQQQKVSANALSDEQLISVFSTGEKVERTLRTATPNTNVVGEKSSKKKKSKK